MQMHLTARFFRHFLDCVCGVYRDTYRERNTKKGEKDAVKSFARTVFTIWGNLFGCFPLFCLE